MSGRQWTFFQLDILMHHAGSHAPFDREDAPLYRPTVIELMALGLLRGGNEGEGPFKTTERGDTFLEMLLATPLPRQVWLDPRTNKEVLREYAETTARPPEYHVGTAY